MHNVIGEMYIIGFLPYHVAVIFPTSSLGLFAYSLIILAFATNDSMAWIRALRGNNIRYGLLRRTLPLTGLPLFHILPICLLYTSREKLLSVCRDLRLFEP